MPEDNREPENKRSTEQNKREEPERATKGGAMREEQIGKEDVEGSEEKE